MRSKTKSKTKKAGAAARRKRTERESEFAKYEFSVMDVCKTLHCAMTGSGYCPLNVFRMSKWLNWRVHYAWDTSSPDREEFDNAVKRLALATLSEEKEAWWNTGFDRSLIESDTQRERKRIAAFLRTLRLNARANAKDLADMIERGDHDRPNP